MRSHLARVSIPLLTGACCSAASAGLVWDKTFTTGPNGVVQFDTAGGNTMIGPVTNDQLPVTTVDNGTNPYTPDKAGEPLGATLSGQNAFSGLYNFDWSNLNTQDESDQAYEAVGFLGTAGPQTRQIMGAILRHWYVSAGNPSANQGYYLGLDLAFGSVGITDFGYNGTEPAIFLGTSVPTETFQLAIGFTPTTNTLTAELYDGSGDVLETHSAVISNSGGMYGAHPPAYDSNANIQSELNNLAAKYLGWEDYTGNGNDIPTTWDMNSLSYYNDATGAFNAAGGNAPVTWNNSGATGDGVTWDTTNQNWNNGSPTTYSDGKAVVFNDNNNGHYAVTLNSTVLPASVTFNNSAGNYTIGGTGTIGGTASLTKSGSGTLTLSTANTYSGGTTVSAGELIVAPTSSMTSALPKGAVTITGGTLQLATNVTAGSQSPTTPTSNVNITSLAISGNGTLDITNNHVIIDYTPGNDPISSIVALISSGYGSGTWTGTGIASSSAAANSGSYGIGYADAADPGNPAGLSSGQIEIMYTLYGDANLDGKVNGTDFTLMAAHFNDSVTNGWDEGDFDYSNAVNGGDFVLLADNFNQFASQSAVGAADLAALDAFASSNGISLTAVPEPASAGLCALGAMGVLARRRHRLKS
jgi:autotransporter-associated beta strand protein